LKVKEIYGIMPNMSREDIKIKIVADGVPYYMKMHKMTQELMERISRCPHCEAKK